MDTKFLEKKARNRKLSKESIFNKWFWSDWMSACRRVEIEKYLSPCPKHKSKSIKNLNINPNTEPNRGKCVK